MDDIRSLCVLNATCWNSDIPIIETRIVIVSVLHETQYNFLLSVKTNNDINNNSWKWVSNVIPMYYWKRKYVYKNAILYTRFMIHNLTQIVKSRHKLTVHGHFYK